MDSISALARHMREEYAYSCMQQQQSSCLAYLQAGMLKLQIPDESLANVFTQLEKRQEQKANKKLLLLEV